MDREMGFYNILLVALLIPMSESRFEDFVIKDKNDLQRFENDDYVDEESFEFEDNSLLDMADMLQNIALENFPPDFLQKLQQHYGMIDQASCFEDADNLLPFGDANNDNDANF